MAYKPFVPCRHPGCPELIPPGEMFCAKHKPQHSQDRANATQRGYGYKWQKARAEYLSSHPLCVECLAHGEYVEATVVDHIIPHRGDQKLFWDRSNWQALCKPCHDKKTGTFDSRPLY